jgi:hypothetical protein
MAAPEEREVSRKNSGHLTKPPVGKFMDVYENGSLWMNKQFIFWKFMDVY